MEDILDGFDRMDVDEPYAEVTDKQLPHLLAQRNASSESIAIWFSATSNAASRAPSYSSGAQSSPHMSEVELPISGEGTLEAELDDGSRECTLEMSE